MDMVLVINFLGTTFSELCNTPTNSHKNELAVV
jgi:hypothetical protein